jgi:hypothetical protein
MNGEEDAIHSAKHDVEDEEAWLPLADDNCRLLSRVGYAGVVALGGKYIARGVGNRDLIVHHEDPYFLNGLLRLHDYPDFDSATLSGLERRRVMAGGSRKLLAADCRQRCVAGDVWWMT